MAECPSPQEDENDVWEECIKTFVSTENIPQLNLEVSNQENRKPEVTTQGEISQTWKQTKVNVAMVRIVQMTAADPSHTK